MLEKITGIDSLIPDCDLGSGGVHRSTRGGFLNIHADFTVHPYKKNWHRRLNVLVYLNERWEDSWGVNWNYGKNMNCCVQDFCYTTGALFLILTTILFMDILNP